MTSEAQRSEASASTDWLAKIARAAEFIFAIPLAVAMTLGIIYLFSWFMLGPILLPFAIAADTGVFIFPFVAVNVAGVSCVVALFLVDKYLDMDRVLFTGLAQMAAVAVAAGAYHFG